MGIYKRFADVPSEYRLESFSDQYENEPTYEQFFEQDFFEHVDSERTMQNARFAGRRWRAPWRPVRDTMLWQSRLTSSHGWTNCSSRFQ